MSDKRIVQSIATASNLPLHEFIHLAISRSGDKIVAVETADRALIVVRNAADGSVIAVHDPAPGHAYTDPSFSPDGRSLAVLATCENSGASALWTSKDDEWRKEHDIVGRASQLRYAHDGSAIAFLVTSAVDNSGPAFSDVALTLLCDARAEQMSQSIVVVDLNQRSRTFVSPLGRFIYDFDWTPDDRGFIAIVTEDDGDNGWYSADIRFYDRISCEERLIARPHLQIASPRVSSDGRQIAFIGGLMSDSIWPGGDIFLVSTNGGDPICITPSFAGSVTSIHWLGEMIIATALVDDVTDILVVDPERRLITRTYGSSITMAAGRQCIAVAELGDRIAAVIQDFEHAPEIAVGTMDELSFANRITDENAHHAPSCNAESIIWDNEGFALQGWLLSPRAYDRTALHPLVLNIHGGPANSFVPRFPSSTFHDGIVRRLLNAGYFVFQPNPRGSYGKGASFTHANHRDFGGGDFRDLISGVDAVLAQAPIDPERLGVVGHSYGGFLAMWTTTQSDRFKVAVAGAGISNWTSYYGQTGIEQWMAPFLGANPYDDPDLYQEISPISYVKETSTPTLLYVGTDDIACPQAQSMEFWRALKTRGIPTSLQLFAGEGHEFCQPVNIARLCDIQFAWLDQFLSKSDSI